MGKQFITTDGKYTVERVSRWIEIKHAGTVTKRNSLYCYAMDSYGENLESDKADPSAGIFLDYFKFGGRKYAIEQFYLLGTMFIPNGPYCFVDTDKQKHYITAVDMDGNIFNPLYLELDGSGEKVRLYYVSENK